MSAQHAVRASARSCPRALKAPIAKAALAVLFALPCGSQAQQAATPTAGSRTIVITASRFQQAIDQAPVATSVVTKDDLAQGNAMILDQAVTRVPGVFSRRSKGVLDTLGGIQIRSVPDGNRTLVLLSYASRRLSARSSHAAIASPRTAPLRPYAVLQPKTRAHGDVVPHVNNQPGDRHVQGLPFAHRRSQR